MNLRMELDNLSKDNPGAAVFIDTLSINENFYGDGVHRIFFNVGASSKCDGNVEKSVLELSEQLTKMADQVRDGLLY